MKSLLDARPETEQPKLRWTREEAARLAELFPDQRYELIEGELINKMGQKPPHAYVVALLTHVLQAHFPKRVRTQLSIDLPGDDGLYSEPEPDAVVLNRNIDEFAHRHPAPEDIALLIEVAYSSLERDLGTKANLYARNGIPEYWIIDIVGRRALVHRHPEQGGYRTVTASSGREILSFGPWQTTVDELLPPA
jgi:Uma2 family endonuclease